MMKTWLRERTRAMWLTLACSRSKQWRRGRQRQLFALEVNSLRSQPMKRKAKNSLERQCHKLETRSP
jgi:5-methylthioribose kinase